ncbi:MAG: hypothetical protein ACK55I_29950, partial [bacterium]
MWGAGGESPPRSYEAARRATKIKNGFWMIRMSKSNGMNRFCEYKKLTVTAPRMPVSELILSRGLGTDPMRDGTTNSSVFQLNH